MVERHNRRNEAGVFKFLRFEERFRDGLRRTEDGGRMA